VFLWSILAALYPAQSNPLRLSHYVKHESAVNMAGLDYPVSTKQIPHFESNNPEISVNVFTVDEDAKSFCVEYLSPHRSRTHHINLLLLEDPSNPAKRHYTYVKNMAALVSHRTKHNGKTYVCNSCLQPFQKQDTLGRHIPFCVKHDAQQVVYPNTDDESAETKIVQVEVQSWRQSAHRHATTTVSQRIPRRLVGRNIRNRLASADDAGNVRIKRPGW